MEQFKQAFIIVIIMMFLILHVNGIYIYNNNNII